MADNGRREADRKERAHQEAERRAGYFQGCDDARHDYQGERADDRIRDGFRAAFQILRGKR